MVYQPRRNRLKRLLDHLEVPEVYRAPEPDEENDLTRPTRRPPGGTRAISATFVPDPKRVMGRPKDVFNPEQAQEFLERLEEGEALHSIYEDVRMPGHTVVNRWKRENPEFAAAWAQARLNSAEGCELQSLKQALTASDNTNASAAKVRAEAWAWAAKMRNPRVYGDRQIISGDPDNPLIVERAAQTRAELIARLEAMARPEPLTIEGSATERKQ